MDSGRVREEPGKNKELTEMSAVIEEEKRLDVRTSQDMYEILKGTGNINKAVNDALDSFYREKKDERTATIQLSEEYYNALETTFTDIHEAQILIIKLSVLCTDTEKTKNKLDKLLIEGADKSEFLKKIYKCEFLWKDV